MSIVQIFDGMSATGLAQSVERTTFNRVVDGSIPSLGAHS
jgi:hypothetical protein